MKTGLAFLLVVLSIWLQSTQGCKHDDPFILQQGCGYLSSLSRSQNPRPVLSVCKPGDRDCPIYVNSRYQFANKPTVMVTGLQLPRNCLTRHKDCTIGKCYPRKFTVKVNNARMTVTAVARQRVGFRPVRAVCTLAFSIKPFDIEFTSGYRKDKCELAPLMFADPDQITGLRLAHCSRNVNLALKAALKRKLEDDYVKHQMSVLLEKMLRTV